MLKKKFAAASVAVLAAFLILPAATAANAATYVPSTSTVSDTVIAGEVATAGFAAGAFDAGSSVNFSVTGPGLAVLSTFKAATATIAKTATGTGAVTVNVAAPASAPGNYSVTATGTLNGAATVGVATVTAVAADSDAGRALLASTGDALAGTGFNAPLLVVWGAVGVILLGVAMVAVLRLQRRSAASAVAAA
ncbi:hypothetical protein E3T55_18980 [Cryobacterium frigoriphilum]|uniref:Sortase n=1 Tax=Cryobacterium frigoriphilum TaxID=1259150 RepID=A0A4R8ZTW8_9MICO|nr:hypothetical protein [Cryobacterium frigoriphilum]TFD45354.1 hypothetical protein E3T55_18980 [Cryobacterium frigoriphilum]